MPAFLALALCLGGCGANKAKLDISEIRDPLIRKAKAKVDQGDRDGALECYNLALGKRPDLAQAHLDAGLLYDEYKKDYVRAVYHYQRYLELSRLSAEKKGMIEERIAKCRQELAAAAAGQPPGLSERLKALQEENERLKKELQAARENQGQLAKAAAPDAAGQPGNAAGDAPVAPPGAQLYRVQEHDTLTTIASKVYRNPGKWKAIYEANQQTLENPERLKPGQLLIIPR